MLVETSWHVLVAVSLTLTVKRVQIDWYALITKGPFHDLASVQSGRRKRELRWKMPDPFWCQKSGGNNLTNYSNIIAVAVKPPLEVYQLTLIGRGDTMRHNTKILTQKNNNIIMITITKKKFKRKKRKKKKKVTKPVQRQRKKLSQKAITTSTTSSQASPDLKLSRCRSNTRVPSPGLLKTSYFSFQPVLHDWCDKGRGMYYPICGMMHIKEPLLLIGRSSLCGGSGFSLSLPEWSLTICLTPYNRKENVLSASLNKTFPSFLP